MPKLRKRLFVKLQESDLTPISHADDGGMIDRIEHWRQESDTDTANTDEIFFGGRTHSTENSTEESTRIAGVTEEGIIDGDSLLATGPTPTARLKKRVKSYKLDVLDGISPASAQLRMRIRSSNAQRIGSDTQTEDAEAISALVHDLRVPTTLMAIIVVLFCLAPDQTLQLMLTMMVLCEEFPDWMPSWIGLIAMVIPMELKARLEVTLFLAMVVWLWKLEWELPWRRVLQWMYKA